MIIFLIALPLLVLVSVGLQAAGTWSDAIRFRPPGKIFAGLHVREIGEGAPTVILESGLAASSVSWVLVQAEIGKFARAVSYDRAGLGFSADSAKQHSLHQLLDGLHSASRSGRCILVGHSFGGLLVQAYAHEHAENVSGLVLIDPVSLRAWADPTASELQRLRLGAKLCRRGALLARIGIVRAALLSLSSGSRFLPSLIGQISAGKGSSVMARLAGEVAKLPPETHPIVRAHWSRPNSFLKLADYLEDLPSAAKQALAMRPPNQIPMIILSASTATPAELAEREEWIANRPGSTHIVVPNTTHWIQLDRPDLVVQAVRAMIQTS